MVSRDQDVKINKLRKEYLALAKGKSSLLDILIEAEQPELVFNSNAIENSTLSIAETERILMDVEFSRNVSVREIFEAKNLARVSNYLRKTTNKKVVDEELLILIHQMLIGNISDDIAGRYRKGNELVRVGTHIPPAPKHIKRLLSKLFADHSQMKDKSIVKRLSYFHLEFERIHPFMDGNGRIGRVIMNFQLMREGLPPIIVRDKGKQTYYKAFTEYISSDYKHFNTMNTIIGLGLLESLHKRIAYLKGQSIITVAAYSKKKKLPLNSLLNKAKRQTIPAFREKGVWKIAREYKVS